VCTESFPHYWRRTASVNDTTFIPSVMSLLVDEEITRLVGDLPCLPLLVGQQETIQLAEA